MNASKRKKKRESGKQEMSCPKTNNEWIQCWRGSVEQIGEKAVELINDRKIYRVYLETILSNNMRDNLGHDILDKSNEFFHLLERMYYSHILVALRTFDDTDSRSHSLYNLIEEMIDHPEVITRDWFLSGCDERFKRKNEREYVKDWGNGPYLSRDVLKEQQSLVKDFCSKIRPAVNKYIAHNGRDPQPVSLSDKDIDTAIDNVFKIMNRYYFLLFQNEFPDYPIPFWTQVFDVPWNSQIR